MSNPAPTGPETATPDPGTQAPQTDLTGRTLGDYHVLRRLGQGGMGQVYVAEQLSLKRKVALKILKAELVANASALQRFKAEAEAVARATHANIVQVYQTGEADGYRYIALEYVEGKNLREFLAKKGPPELLLALSIMRQVAAALQRASELGIIHRDIKPDNILLTKKGEVKVTDFGLSRVLTGDQPALHLTQSGVTMGTPLYMSPEQVEGKPVDHRTDIYSFGVTCYHMLAGHPPFTGNSPFEVALMHVRTEPKPLKSIRPDLPDGLCAIVHRMMAKEPAQRFQTGREILRDLARLRDSLSGATTAIPIDIASGDYDLGQAAPSGLSGSSLPEAVTASRRRWLVRLLVVAGFLLAAGVGAGVAWYRQQPGEHAATGGDGTTDARELDAIFNQRTREQHLRELVRQDLAQAGGSRNVPVTAACCLDLALIYLKEDRHGEADEFFNQLDSIDKVRAYHLLGKLGKGIVQGLHSKNAEEAKQSAQLIREAFDRSGVTLPLRRPDPKKQEPEIQMWFDPRLRYWLAQAVWDDLKNGVPEKDFPPPLVRMAKGDPAFLRP
jgi:serine/threonine-protein kinase